MATVGRPYGRRCAGRSAWRPTTVATFLLHTVGSDFDTVLYVRQGLCAGGAEIACHNAATTRRFGPGSFLQLTDLGPERE
jgi:hypothetical protein